MPDLNYLGQVQLHDNTALTDTRRKMLQILGLLEPRETKLIPTVAMISDALRWLQTSTGKPALELYLQTPTDSHARTSKLLIRLLCEKAAQPLPTHLQRVILPDCQSISASSFSRRDDYTFPVQVWSCPDAELISRIAGIFNELSRDELFKALEVEKARAEALLQNMLPDVIVKRIQRDEGTIYDYHQSATILFTDMVGFTEITSHMEAHRLVSLIDHIFRCFDDLSDRRGVEKIKTIGDSYMAASGVPTPVEDHAERMADLALDMLETHRQVVHEENLEMDIRIGIHTGPVVAGVIGHRKYAYDLWGDSVNVASRMESTGVPGEIQISVATRSLLPPRFRCDIRGNVALKGHGSMEAFLLRGRSEPDLPSI